MAIGAIVACICITLGNFIRGWDMSAIAGSLLYLEPDLHIETDPQLQGAVISTTLICAVISAGLSGMASDWLGRRAVVCSTAVLYLLAGIVMGSSQNIYQLLLGRALVGVSNGALGSLAPLYISEVSPPDIRGRLSTLPMLLISFGLIAAFGMDFVVSISKDSSWRLMLSTMVFPSAIFFACILFLVPESPRWLFSKGRTDEARSSLQRLLSRKDVEDELAYETKGLQVRAPSSSSESELQAAAGTGGEDVDGEGIEEGTQSTRATEAVPESLEAPLLQKNVYKKESFWSVISDPGVRRALAIGITLQLFQQASGIQAIRAFSPVILKDAGGDFAGKMGISGDSASIFGSGFTCILMPPAIAVAMKLMDTSGRRYLLLTTTPILAISWAALSVTSAILQPGFLRMVLSLLSLVTFITAYVMGFGPIPSMFCSEIFPTRIRGLCMGVCIVLQWSMGIVVTQTFPVLLISLGLPILFAAYAVNLVAAWIFIYIWVPETKGLTLEDIDDLFSAHKRYR